MKETFKNLKTVYIKYGKEYKSSLIKIIIFSLFGIVTNIVLPLVSAKIIVHYTNSQFDQVIYIAIIMTIILFVENIKIYLIRKNNQVFRRGTVRGLQMDLGRQILKLDQKSLDSTSSGAFIQRLTNDTDKISRIFTNGMVIIIKFLSAIGAFIAILFIDWHMFLYYLLASAILTILNYIKHEKVGKKEIEFRKESDRVAGLTGELVRGERDIKMLNAKKSFLKALDKRIIIQNDKIFETRNIDMKYNLFLGFIKEMFDLIAIILLIYLVKNNAFTVAVGLVLYNYKSTVLANFMEIVSSLLEECKNFNISCDRVFQIIKAKKYNIEKFGDKNIKKIKGNFEFKNVTFGYNDSPVLKNLNLKIDAGKTIGIVGKSGSGKTTIFNLLCKLYDIKQGSITIDGVDINELDEESIRGNITIISQNPYIFNMSIKENFMLVKENVTIDEIEEACKIACLDEFIDSLPEKYDTVIGEGGVNLSGGQKQRLAIARALVQNTKIILFDEATSALDNETQTKIQKAIDSLKGNYTIIIIAHRLSTIVNCDNIMLLENGNIIASGTHSELLQSNKYYQKLCEIELSSKD